MLHIYHSAKMNYQTNGLITLNGFVHDKNPSELKKMMIDQLNNFEAELEQIELIKKKEHKPKVILPDTFFYDYVFKDIITGRKIDDNDTITKHYSRLSVTDRLLHIIFRPKVFAYHIILQKKK